MRRGQKHSDETKAKISMARRNVVPVSQLDYRDIGQVMVNETASILSDYIRQYVGVAAQMPSPESGVFMNLDRVLTTQNYQELAWYDLYDEVERDPHISAVLGTRKLAVAGLDWDIIPHQEGENVAGKDQTVADFVKDNLIELENFPQDMYELLDGIGKGFAVSEIIWEQASSGEWRVKSLMNRPQRRFQFDAQSRTLKLRTLDNAYLGNPLPDRKFLVYRPSAKYENPFGDALLQNVYWMWLFKRVVTKFWATHLEVAVAPIPYVKHPRNANDALKSEAYSIAQSIRSGSFGRLPDNFELLFAEAKTSSQASDGYEKFVDHCNGEITKAMLGQVLTTEGSGKSGSGSKALGEVHNDILEMRTAFSAHALEGTFAQLIKWLVDLNFSGVSGYPKFKFILDEPVDRLNEANIIKTLKEAGYKTDPQYIKDEIGIPLLEEEEVEAQPDLNSNPLEEEEPGIEEPIQE